MADTDRSTDRGFTLTEVIVVLLMVAVLASVIVAVVAVILKNVPTTEARADNSRSYQRMIQWLPRDAASTPPNEFDTNDPPASPSCVGAAGVNLVHMSWDDGPDTVVAEYRLVPDADGVLVQRFHCSSGAGYSDTATIDVTSRIHDAVATPTLDGFDVVGVTLTLTTCLASDCTVGDETIELAAGSRNPLEALATTTTSSTTTTTSTSTTTTTTVAPGP